MLRKSSVWFASCLAVLAIGSARAQAQSSIIAQGSVTTVTSQEIFSASVFQSRGWKVRVVTYQNRAVLRDAFIATPSTVNIALGHAVLSGFTLYHGEIVHFQMEIWKDPAAGNIVQLMAKNAAGVTVLNTGGPLDPGSFIAVF